MFEHNNPDYMSRQQLEKAVEASLTGTLIQDVDLAKKVANSGIIIKALRIDAGLTQVQLGEIAGVHASAIAQYERGIRNPTFETINNLCDAFGVTSDYLMGRRPKSYDDILQNDNTSFILRKIMYFTDDQRSTALSFIKFVDDQNVKKMSEVEKN